LLEVWLARILIPLRALLEGIPEAVAATKKEDCAEVDGVGLIERLLSAVFYAELFWLL
jgi:hypothetical protein